VTGQSQTNKNSDSQDVSRKKREQEILIPILFGEIKTGTFDEPAKEIKILLDSGASGSIISKEFIQNAKGTSA